MAATLKQVAEAAGVSYQTVWRAVHGHPGILPTTRDRLLRIAAQLGYRPNRLAGSLRTRRSHTIGLVVFDVSNSYTARVISGIEAESSKRGYSVLLMSSGDEFEREFASVRSLLERGVDGLIVTASSAGDHRYLRRELPEGFPFVALSHRIPGVPSLTVAVRNLDAGRSAAKYLISRGQRNVAGLFGDLAFQSMRERHDGFVNTLRKGKIVIQKKWIRSGRNNIDFARAATRQIFDGVRYPSALFASTNNLTEGALLGLNDLGLKHGIDVDVVGFDLSYAELLNPPLPVVLQPAFELGELAAKVVLDVIAGNLGTMPIELPINLHTPSMVDQSV